MTDLATTTPGASTSEDVRAELSERLIVGTAIALIERDGFEAFSMRKLGSALSVSAPALYRYIPTRHHLLDLVADQYFAEIVLAEDTADTDWKGFLADFLRSMHRLLLDKPMLAEVLTHQPVDGPTAMRISNTVIGRLLGAGFDGRTAIEIMTNLASFVIGFSMHEIGRLSVDPGERVSRLREADADQYPHLAALAEDWVRWTAEPNFESGVRRLLDSYDQKTRDPHTDGSGRQEDEE